MPPSLLDSLNTLALGFTATKIQADPPTRECTAQLSPPAGTTAGKLSVIEEITKAEIVESAIDLAWRTKDVRFFNTDITDAVINGGMPISDLLTLNIDNVTNGSKSPPGVPGIVGLLSGTVPITTEVTSQVSHPVTVEVKWRIRDDSGVIVSDIQWDINAIDATHPAIHGSGGDITPPIAYVMEQLKLILPVLFGELGGSVIAKRFIVASIRLTAVAVPLSATTVSTGWIDLPPLEVLLPVVLVPTILVMFQHKNFEGLVLVVVPSNSPLVKETVTAALDTLKTVVTPLSAALTILSLVIGEVDLVSGILNSAKVTFRKADEIHNLNDIDLDSHFLDTTEAEDELSSLLFIAAPRRRVECFNGRDFGDSEGQMNVTIGAELCANIANLHSASPVSDPVGAVSVPRTPAGGWGIWPINHDITTFGDELSSIRFGYGDA